VIGDFLIKRKKDQMTTLLNLIPRMSYRFSLIQQKTNNHPFSYFAYDKYRDKYHEISPSASKSIETAAFYQITFDEAFDKAGVEVNKELLQELVDLWSDRIFTLRVD
jgi:hypothetical protein